MRKQDLKKILDTKRYTVISVNGVNTKNRHFYACILINSAKIEKLGWMLSHQSVDLSEWGIVLDYGYGDMPEGFNQKFAPLLETAMA